MFDITLDEKIMDSRNGTKLLNFAKEKNWIVTIEKNANRNGICLTKYTK